MKGTNALSLFLLLTTLFFALIDGIPLSVTTGADSGAGSLRWAMNSVLNAGGTIDVDPVVGTISLSTYDTDFGSNSYGKVGLPTLTNVTVQINGNGVILESNYSADNFRYFLVNGGRLELYNMTIQNALIEPISSSDGGAIRVQSGELYVYSCTFSSNSNVPGNGARGGAIGIKSSGIALIEDSTFYGNQALEGGAIQNSGTLLLSSCTLFNNNGTETPSSLYINGGGTVTIINTIIALSGGSFGFEDVLSYGTVVSLGGNLIGVLPDGSTGWIVSDQTGSLANPIDTQLNPLALNGGHTPTCSFPYSSPARDGGVATNLTEDQTGNPRQCFAAVDSGAYELCTAPTPSTSPASSPSSTRQVPSPSASESEIPVPSSPPSASSSQLPSSPPSASASSEAIDKGPRKPTKAATKATKTTTHKGKPSQVPSSGDIGLDKNGVLALIVMTLLVRALFGF